MNIDDTMDVMRDETFGPVLPITRVHDDDEAIRLANDSRYGLSSSVWSADDQRAEQMAAAIEAGSICINDCLVSYAVGGLPFGGVKESGIGRVHGVEGLRAFATSSRCWRAGSSCGGSCSGSRCPAGPTLR